MSATSTARPCSRHPLYTCQVSVAGPQPEGDTSCLVIHLRDACFLVCCRLQTILKPWSAGQLRSLLKHCLETGWFVQQESDHLCTVPCAILKAWERVTGIIKMGRLAQGCGTGSCQWSVDNQL